jgi:hypothetical protein
MKHIQTFESFLNEALDINESDKTIFSNQDDMHNNWESKLKNQVTFFANL